MSAVLSPIVDGIERGLTVAASRVRKRTPILWTCAISNGASHRLDVQLDDGWLLFRERPDSNTHKIPARDLWSVLRQNATSPAETKFAITSAQRPVLRSELLLAEDVDVERRVRGVIAAFRSSWEGQPPLATVVPVDWAGEVERQCEESGWTSVRRSSGRLTVTLETTPPFQATVNPFGSGVRLGAEVADFNASPAPCREAAAALSLELTGRIRMVRAATDESQTPIRFESSFSTLPEAAEFASAFSGLSIAVTCAAEALGALQDEDLARDYLAVRGWTADVPKPKPERTST